MGEFVARNMLGWFRKINKRKSCCIFLVVYIVEENLMNCKFSPSSVCIDIGSCVRNYDHDDYDE